MLAVRVDYLMERAYAGSFADRALAEWPPHPARLFAAFVAALHDAGNRDDERTALEWLARQGAPSIRAADGIVRSTPDAYVVTNYDSGKSTVPALRERQKRHFPAVAPEETTAWFIWPSAEPEADVRDALDGITRRVGYLGRSHSSVAISLCDDAPTPNYVPSDEGERPVRIIGRNRLQELETAYEAQLWPAPTTPQRSYGRLTDRRALAVPGEFGHMIVLRFGQLLRLPIECTLTVTTVLRRAVIDHAGRSGEVAEWIHGHNGGSHVSYVALPDIGHRHARGEIKGVGLLLPRVFTAPQRQEILTLARRVQELDVPELGKLTVTLAEEGSIQALHPETWSRPARVWSSVTPIVLDRFPRRDLTAEDIIAASVIRMGLPMPVEVATSSFPALHGVPPAGKFRLRRKADEAKRWAVHASVAWDEEVEGPLLIGAGRYFGLGLMRGAGTEPRMDRDAHG